MPEFHQLLDKYLRDELSDSELQIFLEEVRKPEHFETLDDEVARRLQEKYTSTLADADHIGMMFRQMLQKTVASRHISGPVPVLSLKNAGPYKWIKLIAAACILLLLGAGTYFLLMRTHQPLQVVKVNNNQPPDVAPGTNKATLTLSDGTTIDLDGAATGAIGQQGNALLLKNANGELLYKTNGNRTSVAYYNTMTTPRGGQYKLILPDGTQVWLNASSSIRYPAVFNEKERKVSMEGEAYFEVASKKEQPFIVNTNGIEVHVTGTHFNVNAYSDESAIKTTLLEGAVTVKKGDVVAMLQPGDQVEAHEKGLSAIKPAEVEDVVAWKNGLFSFNGDDLSFIMRQLARWYNLEVNYEGTIPKRLFAGKVFRNMNLSETLKVLELSNIHFRLEGNKLTVIP